MILLLAAAAQAAEPVPFVLPAGADPVVWAEVAAGVGLQIVPPGSGAWAEIAQNDAGPVLVVHDPSGAKRTVAVAAPTTRAAREDALLLAVSLLRPFSGGEKGWATPPPPPRTWKPVKATLVPPSVAPEPPPPWIEAPEIAMPPSPPGPRLPTPPEFPPVEAAQIWASLGPSLVARPDVALAPAVSASLVREARFRIRVGVAWSAPAELYALPGGGILGTWRLEGGAGDCLGGVWSVCGGADVGLSAWRFSERDGAYVGRLFTPRASARVGVERALGGSWRASFEAVGALTLGSVYVMRQDAIEAHQLSPTGFEPTLSIQTKLP